MNMVVEIKYNFQMRPNNGQDKRKKEPNTQKTQNTIERNNTYSHNKYKKCIRWRNDIMNLENKIAKEKTKTKKK